jgi:2'-5' RNA ligase
MTTRTFIALEMSTGLQRHLKGFFRQVASALPSLRRVDSAGIHLTLAFLGELTDEQVASAIAAAQDAAQAVSPFSYHLTQPGIFGSARQPRVLWMGIEEPSGALQTLHRSLNAELEARGFETERRPFSPHLTLARGKAPLSPDEQAALQHLLTRPPARSTASHRYLVTGIQVIKSELQQSGARYTVLFHVPLQA